MVRPTPKRPFVVRRSQFGVRGSALAVLNSEKRMAIAGRFPGGRRRCEMAPIYGQYCEGTGIGGGSS